MLDRLPEVPITPWRFLSEPQNIRHLGATAQDFEARFGLGDNDKMIGLLDASGVACAAIQGLNAKLEQQIAELRGQVAEVDVLRRELTAVKATLAELEGHATVVAH